MFEIAIFSVCPVQSLEEENNSSMKFFTHQKSIPLAYLHG